MTLMMNDVPDISAVQRQILTFIKQQGGASNVAIARELNVSYEAVRQQLRQLEAIHLVTSHKEPAQAHHAGRPTRTYSLSPAGDRLFPKAYDELTVGLIDTLTAVLGPDALRQTLTSLTDDTVRRWEPQLQDKTLPERLEALKSLYLEDDAFMDVRQDVASGELLLVERNCPYLNVALRRPALCSVTASALSRLLGYTVTREKRFQDGDGCCAFRVHLDRPVNTSVFHFAYETETNDNK